MMGAFRNPIRDIIMRPHFARAVVLAAVLVAVSQSSQAQTVVVGPNINVSKRAGSESETAIVIDRSNTQRVVISSNWDATNMFHAISTNAGSTWATGAVGVNACCDPWLGSDSFGNIYLSYLNATTTTIARSTNGGATFTTLTTFGTSTDHPELAVGPGNVAGTQSVWVTHRNFSGSNGIQVTGAQSTALGTTGAFTTTQTFTGTTGANFGDIAIGPNGVVTTTYMASSGGVGPSNLPVWHDANGITTGGATQVNNSIVTQVGAFRPIPAQPNRTIDTQVDLAYDFSGGANNGRLYMLYTQAANTTTNNTNIVIRRSNDNGATWSAETQINDDGGVNSQFFGRVAVDQTTGYLAAVWLDARNAGAGNILVELWGSVSADGGVTWLPNFKISQGQWDGRQANTGDPNEMGDYISLDYHDGAFVVAWADASNALGNNPDGTTGLDIFYARVTVAPVPEPASVLLVAAAGVAVGRRLRRNRTTC